MTGFGPHDHKNCIRTGIARADAQCAQAGLQFTPVRRRVLEILLQEHRALGAYEVLEFLRDEGLGSQPPVAYRALDFLTKNGFAHKIERLNAFVACTHSGAEPAADHNPVFLICQSCSAIDEIEWGPAQGQIGGAAARVGFTVDAVIVEAMGTCPACREGRV